MQLNAPIVFSGLPSSNTPPLPRSTHRDTAVAGCERGPSIYCQSATATMTKRTAVSLQCMDQGQTPEKKPSSNTASPSIWLHLIGSGGGASSDNDHCVWSAITSIWSLQGPSVCLPKYNSTKKREPVRVCGVETGSPAC